MTYSGLGQYQRERPDPTARRDSESEEGWRRRIAPILRHAEDAVSADDWAAFRNQVDATTASAVSALDGANAPKDRAAAWGRLWAAGEQRVEKLGHLTSGIHVPGGVAPARIYPAEIEQREQAQRRGLADGLRSSGEGWLVR